LAGKLSREGIRRGARQVMKQWLSIQLSIRAKKNSRPVSNANRESRLFLLF
jgi:hypothetical protein